MKRCLSIKEAANYCGVSVTTFNAEVRPFVPPLRIGKRIVWDRLLLDNWIDKKSGVNSQKANPSGSLYEEWKTEKREAGFDEWEAKQKG